MKILTGLLVALMLSVLVAGCQQTPTEVTYKGVSVGSMTVSVPTDWQRYHDSEEYIEETISGMGSDIAPYVQMDAYEDPKSQDFALSIMVQEMSKITEATGMTWEGWESALENSGMTKESMLTGMAAAFVGEGAEEVTQQETLQHTIHGCE